MKIRGGFISRLHQWLFYQIPLVALLCSSLVMMGAIFWAGNRWALITDADPTTMTRIDLLLNGRMESGHQPVLDKDGNGVIPIAGGMLILGNGDQDDNKEEAFLARRTSQAVIQPHAFKAVTNFSERRTVAAYKDFWHLKVMPAADIIIADQEKVLT